MTAFVEVIQPGRTAVTDLGRARGPLFGMPVNGALDQQAARAANALVGNLPDAPLLELLAFDFAARLTGDALIAVTGAETFVTVDGNPVPTWEPVLVGAGQTLRVTHIRGGMRVYVAFFGSLDAPRLMDSCAPDTVLGFGTHLAAGTRLALLRTVPPFAQPGLGVALFDFAALRPPRATPLVIDVVDGPDIADFGDTAGRLFAAPFRVGASSNHVGLRFEGDPPQRQSTQEILSRGIPVGAVEVPAGTEVLVLHRGRGVTAGYPVLGVVTEAGLDALAQARPGDEVWFHHTSVEAATQEARQRRAAGDNLARRVSVAFEALQLYDLAPGDPRWSGIAPTIRYRDAEGAPSAATPPNEPPSRRS